MDKAKLIFQALPWGLVSVILWTAGLPPPVIAFIQAVWDNGPQIAAVVAPVITTALTAWGALAKKKPDAPTQPPN